MGGGSTGYFSSGGIHSGSPVSEDQISLEIESALRNTRELDFESELNEELKNTLSIYNEKDTELVNERLNEIKNLISDYLDNSINIKRAGSWKKHTYVDGLSDVDCLFVLPHSKFSVESPQQLLQELEKLLKKDLGKKANVERGNLSLKISYEDGPDLQILLALKRNEGVRIPSGKNDEWSNVVNLKDLLICLQILTRD